MNYGEKAMNDKMSLEQYAMNANVAYSNLSEFLACSVFSKNPDVLVYKFSTVTAAAAFLVRVSTNAKPGTFKLKPGSFNEVFQHVIA